MDLLKSRDLYLRIFENAVVAIGVTNAEGYYVLVNKAWCDFLGYTAEEASSIHVSDITPEEETTTSTENFLKLMAGELQSIKKRRRYKRKNGTLFWADLFVSTIHDEAGNPAGILGIFTNIEREVLAEQNRNELTGYLEKLNDDLQNAHAAMQAKNEELEIAYKKLERLARHDGLTGLYNRRTLEEIIAREVQRSVRTKRGFAIGIADIDNFKHINDNYGHDCGDYVLKTMASIFLDKIRQTDTVGRWGGEEFLFVFPETTCEGARIVQERIRATVETTIFNYKGQILKLSVTIGFSYHFEQCSVDEMIIEADKALYEGKQHGKNRVVCHQSECTDLQPG